MFRTLFLVAFLLNTASALAAPTGPGTPPPIPRELLQKRYDAARSAYEQMYKMVQGDETAPDLKLLEWSERWLEAELATKKTSAERVAALQSYLERTTEMEILLAKYVQSGQARESEAKAAQYFRSDAEIRLFLEKRRP